MRSDRQRLERMAALGDEEAMDRLLRDQERRNALLRPWADPEAWSVNDRTRFTINVRGDGYGADQERGEEDPDGGLPLADGWGDGDSGDGIGACLCRHPEDDRDGHGDGLEEDMGDGRGNGWGAFTDRIYW